MKVKLILSVALLSTVMTMFACSQQNPNQNITSVLTEGVVGVSISSENNVRTLMKSEKFPITKVGKRQVVSIINFVTYITSQNNN